MLTNEPCEFCLLTCHATVQMKRKNLAEVRDKGKTIKSATPILPNCQTYSAQLSREFQFKHFKFNSGFSCTNRPVYCKLCQDFVWSYDYNLKNHFRFTHVEIKGVPTGLQDQMPKQEEIDKLFNLFKINARQPAGTSASQSAASLTTTAASASASANTLHPRCPPCPT